MSPQRDGTSRPFRHFRLVAFFCGTAVLGILVGIWRLRRLGDRPDPDDVLWLLVTTVLLVALTGFTGVFVHRLRVLPVLWRETEQYLLRIHRESEKYRALMEGAADILLIVDPKTGRVKEWNARAREELGLPASPAEPLPIGSIVATEDLERFGGVLQDATAGEGSAVPLVDIHLRGKDGRALVADGRAAAIRLDDDHIVQVSLRDLTRQKEMERQLQIRERLSSIGLLTAGVAHEINNPLEGIGNYLQLLEKEDADADKRRRHLEQVRHGFARIREIVRDLLRFARPATGQGEADLAQVVERARRLAAYSKELADVQVEVDGLDRPLAVEGDAGRLEQVVFNLLLNAGTAMRAKGRIQVAARRPVELTNGVPWIELSVADEGPGIPPADLERIFDPFFTTTQGTGLGLSVSYGIVKAHGGTLGAENRDGGGAVFTVRLPGEDAGVKAQDSVLVVDDEAFVRDSLAAILAAEGWKTHTAGGAREAIEQLAREHVDVILTDLRMPEGNAFDLLDHARAGGVEIPIVVITGVGTVAEAVRAMKAGAYDFLQKPVDPEELVLLARRAAEHHRLLHEVQSLREAVQGLRAPRILLGRSPAMERVRGLIAQVAPTETAVLVTGESGTGKDLAAEEIHEQSARASRPLVRVHCAAGPSEAFEKDLFGGNLGAFARAEGGTLVLDEVGVLAPSLQARLLGVLETGKVQLSSDGRSRTADVRVIAITNEDLAARVKSGAFRSDLLYRLDVFRLEMPPLRDHREDVPEIVEHLLSWARQRRTGAGSDAGSPRLAPEALEVLVSYGWPGNVRELRNVLERAVIVAGERDLDAMLVRSILESALTTPVPSGPQELHLRRNLDATEKEIVLRALAQAHGKKKEASLLLGIDPRNLGYYLRKHGIESETGKRASS